MGGKCVGDEGTEEKWDGTGEMMEEGTELIRRGRIGEER